MTLDREDYSLSGTQMVSQVGSETKDMPAVFSTLAEETLQGWLLAKRGPGVHEARDTGSTSETKSRTCQSQRGDRNERM